MKFLSSHTNQEDIRCNLSQDRFSNTATQIDWYACGCMVFKQEGEAVRGTCTKRDSQILTIDQSQTKKIYLLLNEETSFKNYQSKMTVAYATFSSEVLLRLHGLQTKKRRVKLD